MYLDPPLHTVVCFNVVTVPTAHLQVDRNRLSVEALELLKLIPQGYMPLPHQVGGHRHVDGKLGEYGKREGEISGGERERERERERENIQYFI